MREVTRQRYAKILKTANIHPIILYPDTNDRCIFPDSPVTMCSINTINLITITIWADGFLRRVHLPFLYL